MNFVPNCILTLSKSKQSHKFRGVYIGPYEYIIDGKRIKNEPKNENIIFSDKLVLDE